MKSLLQKNPTEPVGVGEGVGAASLQSYPRGLGDVEATALMFL